MTTDRVGAFRVDHPVPLIAGRPATIVFEYTVGEAGFGERSTLRVCLPNTGWDPPLLPEPYCWPEYQRGPYRQYTEYGRANTSVELVTGSVVVPMRHERHALPAGVALGSARSGPAAVAGGRALMRMPGDYPNSRIYNMRRWWITVRVEEGRLGPGDRIRIVYGDPREEQPGAVVQRFPENRLVFLAYVDLDGAGRYVEVPGSRSWPVLPSASRRASRRFSCPATRCGCTWPTPTGCTRRRPRRREPRSCAWRGAERRSSATSHSTAGPASISRCPPQSGR